MKDIKNYLCTLEQAKKLKELGVKQDSLFYWNERGNIVNSNRLSYKGSAYSAFTSQELLELIIQQLDKMEYSDVHQYLHSYAFYAHKEFTSMDEPRSYEQYPIDYPVNINQTEAQARAEFLIYLLQQKETKKLCNQ